MLYRMHVRYAEKKDWKVTVLDVVPGEGIGLDKATIQIEGRNAFRHAESEKRRAPPRAHQPHRRQRSAVTPRSRAWRCCRCCPTTSRWISTPADVRVDVYRSSRPRRPVRQHHRLGRASFYAIIPRTSW